MTASAHDAVTVEVIASGAGLALAIEDRRLAGSEPEPSFLAQTICTFEASISSLVAANNSVHPRDRNITTIALLAGRSLFGQFRQSLYMNGKRVGGRSIVFGAHRLKLWSVRTSDMAGDLATVRKGAA